MIALPKKKVRGVVRMKYLITYLLFLGIAFSIAGYATASDTRDAEILLDRFRSIDWSILEVGQNKNLHDDAWKVRIEVENELIALGENAMPILIKACQDSNKHVRLLAAYVLGNINDGSAIPALMQILSDDPYAPARLMAVEALGRLGAREALDTVQAATEDESAYVINAANWALPLVKKGEDIGNVLRDIVASTFDKSKIASAIVGKPAPDFTVTDDSGETVRLADFRGKKNVALIFLLADW